ncbi:MAG: autotransporter domain-containing protein, partial [Verrucomicrobiota bacterium]
MTFSYALGASITWNVAGSGTWDTTTSNWSSGNFTDGSIDDVTFNNAAGGTITISPNMTPISTTVGAAAGTYTFSGGPIDGGTLSKSGAGILVLTGANSYAGATSISGGVLNVQNDTALGTTAGSTSIGNGAALQLQGGVTVTGEALTLIGNGISNDGALRNILGNNTWTGNLTSSPAATTRIASDAGTLTISGNVAISATASDQLVLQGNGNGEISGSISGASRVTKGATGTGTWILSGANTYAGNTTVSGGVLNIRNNTALGTTAGSTSVSAGAALQMQGDITVTGEALTIVGDGVSNDGALRNISGNNTWTGNVTITSTPVTRIASDAGTLTISGNIGLSATSTDQFVLQGNGNGEVSGVVSGASRLTKGATGTGIWTLSGANTFTASTTISNGTLSVSSLNSVVGGSASSNLGAPVTVANGTIGLGATTVGTLLYTGSGETTDRVINLAGTSGGAKLDQSGTGLLKFSSDLTATGAGAKTLTLQGSSAGAGELAGVIVDSGGGATSLAKSGTDTWTLSGTNANSFTGTLQVNGGILVMNKTSGVNAIGNITATVNSGGTLQWLTSNQVGNSATMVLNGGALNFNGKSETMGTLDLDASSSLTFGSGAEAVVFSDSSALNWGAFTLTINSFTNGIDTLKFGTTAAGLTAAQLAQLSFLELGGVGGQIDLNGFVTALANNGNLTVSTNYTGTQNVTQTGTGSMTLTGTNTSTGTATVNSGLLSIGNSTGGNWFGNVVANGGILKGRGTITGSVTVNNTALYSPGNSPGIQQIGSLTVNPGGTLLIEIDGGVAGNGNGFHDQVQSIGAATLNGGTLQGFTIFGGSNGFKPAFGTRINFLNASSVIGSFSTYDFTSNTAGQSWIVEYRDTEANLFAVPADWGRDIAGITPNQKQVGRALQSFAPTAIDARGTTASGVVSSRSDQGKIFNGLMRLDNGGLKTAYDQLSPEKLTAMSSSVSTLSSIANGGTSQRLSQIRRGDKGVSLNGLTLRTLDGDDEYEKLALNEGTLLVKKKKETLQNSFFVNTTGSYAKVDTDENRIGFENRLGGLTAGIDREITPNLTLGAFASQGYADTLLSGGGSLESNSGRLGIYGGYHQRGFYLNSSLSGGMTSFDSKRKLSFLGDTADGSTQGEDIAGQVLTGLDLQTGNWVWGPMGKIDYGYQSIDRFREHGSAARLQVFDQSQTQLETGAGFRVSRPFDYHGWKWVPEAHLLGSYQWYEPGKIQAQFDAGGNAFTVRPQGAGQTMIIPGIGCTLYLSETQSLNFNYETRVNLNSLAHQL